MPSNRKPDARYKNNDESKNALMIRMISSYSIFLIIILVLFYFIFNATEKNSTEIYNYQSRANFVSNVELFENDIDIMEVYARQILQNKSFRKIMNQSQVTDSYISAGNESVNTMATDVYATALLPITDVFCYFPLTDYILNPTYFIDFSRYYNWIKKYPANLQDSFMELLTDSSNYGKFISLDEYTPNSSKHYYLYSINMEDLYYMEADAIMCFILDESQISTLFNISDIRSSGLLFATNEEGEIILNVFDSETISEIQDNVQNLTYDDSFSSFILNDIEMTIGQYYSSKTGFTYYYFFSPYEFVTNNNAVPFRLIFIILMLLSVILGGVLIHYFIRSNMKPIIDLGEELDQAVEAKTQLQSEVDKQKPYLLNACARRLMLGLVRDDEELSYIKNYLGFTENSKYIVLYINIYDNNSIDDPEHEVLIGDSDYRINAIIGNEKLIDIFTEYLGKPLYYFTPDVRSYAVLISYAENNDSETLELQEKILKLHNYLLEKYSIWLFAGLGNPKSKVSTIWRSYDQAYEAINYTNKNYIFLPYQMIRKDSNTYYYPTDFSTKLISCIGGGADEQIGAIFNIIRQENTEYRSLPNNLMGFLLSDIRNTLFRARSYIKETSENAEDLASIDSKFAMKPNMNLLEEIAHSLCKLNITAESDDQLIDTIRKYITDNFNDPSIGLSKISDEFNISESYFSHMFKEKTGENFSVYLENIRMNEAARLIKETNTSLNELYMAVGYNNANTFRRAFKKKFGITPSNMRDAQ